MMSNHTKVGNTKITRLEYSELAIDNVQGLYITYNGYVSKIKLTNLPLYTYTLSVNGINIMSSSDMEFDIANCFSKNMIGLVELVDIEGVECRCLDFRKFIDIKICYNSSYKQYIPDVAAILLYAAESEPVTYNIYNHRNLLIASSPTEYITIVLKNLQSKHNQIILRIDGKDVINICNPLNPRIVIKFNKNQAEKGIQDLWLVDHDVETLNLSRIRELYVITMGCELAAAYSAHYSTYYLPNDLCDSLIPCYAK